MLQRLHTATDDHSATLASLGLPAGNTDVVLAYIKRLNLSDGVIFLVRLSADVLFRLSLSCDLAIFMGEYKC